MKPFILFGMIILPVIGFSQAVDSATVVREVDSLIQLNRSLLEKKQFDEALIIIEAAKAKAEAAFGKNSGRYATCVFNYGRTFHFKRDYPAAEALYLEAKAIQEVVIGKEHPDYARSLDLLAVLYKSMRRYEDAESFYLEALDIWEKVLGKEHSDYAWKLFTLAVLYYDMGRYQDAESFHLKALGIRGKVLGKEHSDYTNSLSNLAVLYYSMGRYEDAESFNLEAKAIRQKVLGKEHADYTASLNNLGLVYWKMGRYEAAEPLYIEAKDLREKVLGKEHYLYAQTLMNLGLLYSSLGRYETVEPLYLEATAIYEKVFGKEHSEYAAGLRDLANLHFIMGRDKDAEPLYAKVKVIWEKTLGKEHPRYGQILINLASLHIRTKNFETAEQLLLEAMAISEKVIGKEHLHYAVILINLSLVYAETGRYDAAEALCVEAKNIYEKTVGNDHPEYAAIIYNTANLYWAQKRFKDAEPLFLYAKAIMEKTLEKNNPEYKNSLHNLALLYYDMGEYESANPLLQEANSIERSLMTNASRHLSEQEMASYGKLFTDNLHRYYSIAQIYQRTSPEFSGFCFDNAIFHKGFLLIASSHVKKLASSDSITTEKFNLLKSCHRRLSNEYTKPIAERQGVEELEVKANVIEKELVRTVAGFGGALMQVVWQDVQEKLKPGEAAVEFIHYNYYTPKLTDSVMYAALVLRPGDAAPQFVPLFEEQEIAPLLKGASGRADRRINALYSFQQGSNSQKTLHDLIWKPLEGLLEGVKTIYCSPSGLLHRLNLGAIPLNEKQTFADGRQLVLLRSTRQLVLPDNVARTGNDAHLVGGVRYTTDTTAIAANFGFEGTRGLATNVLPFHTDSTVRDGSWNYLPETATEVIDIHKILRSENWIAQLDTGYLASEESFRNLGNAKPSPRNLHVATHGFFFPDPKDEKRFPSGVGGDREPVFKISEHPMIRSGLLLAGAQQAWSTGNAPENRDDGILTAYEISQMNLSGTELVVLSACETGLGDIEGNEGVYGLQRAFKIAGAKYLIMSLWKVSDQSTRELMTDFYRQWLTTGLAIPEAFRTAQGNMKRKYPDAPYHWAGFVLVE